VDRPTVVDIFAGCGGFAFGFAEAEFEIQHAIEAFRPSLATYVANVPLGEAHLGDVRKIDYDAMKRPDLLIGGPPCEAFTVANAARRGNPLSRLYDDPLGSLTLQFIKVAKALAPPVFVMENVPPIMDGPLESELRMIFARNGYPEIHFNRLQAEEHGTPSHRDRVFISNLRIAPPRVPREVPVSEAIGDLVSLDVDIPNHAPPRLGKKQQAAIEALEEGKSAYHYRASGGRVHHTWTRLAPDKLAPTVKGLGRFVHPTEDRLLTPREHARLMGYPDDYVFHGSINEQYNMIGESVPPPLSRAIAASVKQAIAKG